MRAVLVVLFLAATTGVAWSAFSGTTANSGNNFQAAASFPALDHFTIDTVSEQSSGRAFTITVRARTSSGAVFSGYNGTVALSVNGGSITPTTSNNFVNGVLTQAVTITGPYRAAQTITVSGGSPAKAGTSNAFVLRDWNFFFKKTTAYTADAGRCLNSFRKRDMEEGYTGLDPEETFQRTSSNVTLNFCSPAFASASSLRAGTTTVSGYLSNTSGTSCTITATLYKNGTTSLGTASLVVPNSANTLRTWTINSSATSLAAGDRLNLVLSWAQVRACDSAVLRYGGTANRSRVQLPGPQ